MNCNCSIYQYSAPPYKIKHCITASIIHDILSEEYPEYFSLKEKVLIKILKRNCRNSDLIITGSNYTKEQLIKFNYANENKIFVIRYGSTFEGADLNEDEINLILHKYKIINPYCLYVGRLNPRKNIERMVRAFLLNRNKYEHDLIIVGAPDKNYRDFVKFLSQDELSRIKFLGAIPSADLQVLYKKSSLFIYVSLFEGFGLPILESMNNGVPCLVSNTTSMPEVGGNACYYTNPLSTNEIADSILKLLADDRMILNLKHNIPDQIKKYSWLEFGEKLIDILSNY